MLKRIVQERVRRSRKRSKFSLEDDDLEGGLTHRVSAWIFDAFYDASFAAAEFMLSTSSNGIKNLGGSPGKNH